jgi:hypothetical protein
VTPTRGCAQSQEEARLQLRPRIFGWNIGTKFPAVEGLKNQKNVTSIAYEIRAAYTKNPVGKRVRR